MPGLRTARLLTATAALAACAGARTRPGASAPREWLFYTAGDRLVAVHPDRPSRPVEVERGGHAITAPALVRVGRREPGTDRLAGVHTHAVVYFRDDPSGLRTLHAASADGAGRPVSRRVSSLSAPGLTLCDELTILPDHERPDGSLVAVHAARRRDDCATGGDRVLLVRLSMDAGEAPLEPAAWRDVAGIVPLYAPTGALSHLLLGGPVPGADRALRLQVASARPPFGPPTLLVDARDDALAHVGLDSVWILSAARLRRLSADGTHRDVGEVRVDPSRGQPPLASDGRHLYLVDGRTVRRVPLDGERPAETVCALPEGTTVSALHLSARRLVLATRAPDGDALWSVPKDGGEGARISPASSAGDLIVAGGSLFQRDGRRVVARQDDGARAAELADDVDAWLRFPATALAYDWAPPALATEEIAGLVLARSPPAGSATGLRLVYVDGATRETVDLGELPDGYTGPRLLADASGTATLLVARAPARAREGARAAGSADVFLVDRAAARSLRQLTRTPGIEEAPVGSVPAACSTSGGGSLLALGGVLAALRRRRAGVSEGP